MLFEKYDTFIGVVIECKGVRYLVNCGNEMFMVVCKANLAKGEKVLFGVTNYLISREGITYYANVESVYEKTA